MKYDNNKGGYKRCHNQYGGYIKEEDFCTEYPTYSVIDRILKDFKFDEEMRKNCMIRDNKEK